MKINDGCGIKFFMSAEVEGDIGEDYMKLSNAIEDEIQTLFKGNYYGAEVGELSIIPTIFSPRTYDVLTYKERKKYSPKTKEAEFRLKIDYRKFKESSTDEKRRLILKNIIDSVKILDEKTGAGFDGKTLEEDIRKLFDYWE